MRSDARVFILVQEQVSHPFRVVHSERSPFRHMSGFVFPHMSEIPFDSESTADLLWRLSMCRRADARQHCVPMYLYLCVCVRACECVVWMRAWVVSFLMFETSEKSNWSLILFLVMSILNDSSIWMRWYHTIIIERDEPDTEQSDGRQGWRMQITPAIA